MAFETDLWILVFATQPDLAPDLFRDQSQAQNDPGDLPGRHTASDIPALIQGVVNAESPARQRLDTLMRQRLAT